jgi:hypothetical protein
VCASFLSAKKLESFGVNPTLIGESVGPLCGCYIMSFVPARLFRLVEKFPQVRACIFLGAAVQ